MFLQVFLHRSILVTRALEELREACARRQGIIPRLIPCGTRLPCDFEIKLCFVGADHCASDYEDPGTSVGVFIAECRAGLLRAHADVSGSEEEGDVLETELEDLGALSHCVVLCVIVWLAEAGVVGIGDDGGWLPGSALVCTVIVITWGAVGVVWWCYGCCVWICRVESLEFVYKLNLFSRLPKKLFA
jgi:hypothetical protein